MDSWFPDSYPKNTLFTTPSIHELRITTLLFGGGRNYFMFYIFFTLIRRDFDYVIC
jgi:hypothetical protein